MCVCAARRRAPVVYTRLHSFLRERRTPSAPSSAPRATGGRGARTCRQRPVDRREESDAWIGDASVLRLAASRRPVECSHAPRVSWTAVQYARCTGAVARGGGRSDCHADSAVASITARVSCCLAAATDPCLAGLSPSCRVAWAAVRSAARSRSERPCASRLSRRLLRPLRRVPCVDLQRMQINHLHARRTWLLRNAAHGADRPLRGRRRR